VLWGCYWYPLLPVINHAKRAANEPEVDVNQAILELLNLGFFVRSQEIHFKDASPVLLSADEIILEVRTMCFELERITRKF
jgi:hypothetical protein